MEYINTCSLGLHLTPEERKHSSKYPYLDEEQMKIALCLSVEGKASRTVIMRVHQELVLTMLNRRRAFLDMVIETINDLMLEEERSYQDIKEDEKAFQIIVSKAIGLIEKLMDNLEKQQGIDAKSYLELCAELESIKRLLSALEGMPLCANKGMPNSIHYFDSDPEALKYLSRDALDTLRYDLRISLRTFGRLLWDGRISYLNPYNLTEIGKEIRKIDALLAEMKPTDHLPEHLVSVVEHLASFQEFPKPHSIIVHRPSGTSVYLLSV